MHLKRTFDIFFSLLGLILLSPILLIVSLLILIESGKPIFFLQTRVGKNNKDFQIFKFRTMEVDSQNKGLLTLGDDDPRITKTGYFLRKYKLDELPQLLNVLFGSMSFVGPRPEIRKYVNHYTKEDLIIFTVKPGITDPASIAYSNEPEILKTVQNPENYYIENILPNKLSLNKSYLCKMNFFEDLRLIFKTLYVLIRKNLVARKITDK